jgi:hypothetical protein
MTTPVKVSTGNVPARVTGASPKPAPEVEIGVSAFLPFVTPFRNAWEALRDEEVTVNQLTAMRRTDGQARALYRLLTLPIRAALKTATFVPESNVDGGDDEAKFIEQMFTLPESAGGMTVSFNRAIAQMLMAIFDGFAGFEMVYWVPKKGPLKGKWTLKKLAARPAHTLSFLLDDNSEFAGFRQRTMYQGRSIDVIIPADSAVYYAANEEEKPFYGCSYFQSAFYHWDKKFKLYVIAHIAAQRAAVGTRIGTMPKGPDKTEKLEFQKALADLGIAQWMTVPEGWVVDSLKEVTNYDFLSLINHHNSQMSKSVLAAFFDDSQGTGGDASLVDFGRQSDALFMMMLTTLMGEIEEVINQKIIPRFIDWNFDSQKYPKFQFGSLTEEQKSAMTDLFKTLAVAGQSLAISPEFVHELEKQVAEEFGLEIDWEAVEERMAHEQELAEQMAAQGMAPGGPGAGGGVPPAGVPGGPSGGGGAPGPDGVPPAPVHPGHVLVDPSLLPKGFTLSMPGGGALMLTELAADLLAEAYHDVTDLGIEPDDVELTRGRPNDGGPKYVRTAEGARIYGEPIGTPITADMKQKLAAHGVKGKNYGAVRGKNRGGAKGKDHQVLGGGLGAKPQDPGSPLGGNVPKPKQTLTNPKAPGVQLLDYGDGTVALRDSHGHTTPRQRYEVDQFLKLGWEISHAADKAADTAKKGTPKKKTGA